MAWKNFGAMAPLALHLLGDDLQKTGSTLLVALAVPKDPTTLDDLRFASGCEIQTVLALEDEIIAALNRYSRDDWMPDRDRISAFPHPFLTTSGR
jgi:hypothetical protein